MRTVTSLCVAALAAWPCGLARCAEDPAADVADIASQEIELKVAMKGAPTHTYFLIGPRAGAAKPANGHALLVILPGGDGSRDFHPFVKRIFKNAASPDFVAVQLVAVAHSLAPKVIWPTAKTPGLKGTPPTEDFIEAVIADVAARVPIDRTRVYLMGWSSSGPTAYAFSLRKKKSVTGFYISMSVFKPAELPPLGEAKGEAYVIEHSPGDARCPFAMAKDAEKRLTAAGAKVKFVTTSGDHAWTGDVYGRMREAIAWLEENHPGAAAGAKGAAGSKKK